MARRVLLDVTGPANRRSAGRAGELRAKLGFSLEVKFNTSATLCKCARIPTSSVKSDRSPVSRSSAPLCFSQTAATSLCNRPTPRLRSASRRRVAASPAATSPPFSASCCPGAWSAAAAACACCRRVLSSWISAACAASRTVSSVRWASARARCCASASSACCSFTASPALVPRCAAFPAPRPRSAASSRAAASAAARCCSAWLRLCWASALCFSASIR
mmetsp:Transcript_79116/g.181052  ORF Transcript_79116/g.181052 Transcript_79116/m.181052 type:complete len:219 (+) Transcript_79116:395-1051(+)